jgi:RNA polymerase sigma-70 factor, ECF subfamily
MRTNLTAQEQQFQEWIGKYQAILIRIVRSFAAQASDQDDLFQEILLQLWLSLPKFKAQSQESTWIYRVAFNTALGWKRSGKRKNRNLQLLSPQQTPDTGQIKVSQFGSEQVIEQLYQAIHSLPIVDASLVLLALDGLNYKQMAEVLGITESSVGARLTRVKAKLAELLKGKIDEI